MRQDCEQACRMMQKKLDGTLNADDMRLLQSHLAQCPQCRADYDAFSQLEEALTGALVPREVPEEFSVRVMEAVRRQPASGGARVHRVAGWFLRTSPVFRGVAAVAAAAVVFWGVSVAGGKLPGPAVPDGGPSVGERPVPEVPGDPEDPGTVVIPENPGTEVPGETPGQTPDAVPDETDPETPDATETPDREEPGGQDEPDAPAAGETKPPAGTVKPPVSGTPDRNVDDVDLSGQTRLDETLMIASQKGQQPSGTLDLSPLYAGGGADALAPSYGDNGEIVFFLKEQNQSAYSMVSLTPGSRETSVMLENVETDPLRLTRDATSLKTSGLRVSGGALYYQEKALTPELPEASLRYAMAPNDVFVAISVGSSDPDLQGLWITDVYKAELRRLSVRGGGRILGWAPNSDALAFTDGSGNIYLTRISKNQTYLVSSRGDRNQTGKIGFSSDSSRFLLGAWIDGANGVYEVRIP